jgi:hypothetical protein
LKPNRSLGVYEQFIADPLSQGISKFTERWIATKKRARVSPKFMGQERKTSKLTQNACKTRAEMIQQRESVSLETSSNTKERNAPPYRTSLPPAKALALIFPRPVNKSKIRHWGLPNTIKF